MINWYFPLLNGFPNNEFVSLVFSKDDQWVIIFFFQYHSNSWICCPYWYSLASRSLFNLVSKSFDKKFVVFGSFLVVYYDKIFQAPFVHFLLQI